MYREKFSCVLAEIINKGIHSSKLTAEMSSLQQLNAFKLLPPHRMVQKVEEKLFSVQSPLLPWFLVAGWWRWALQQSA